MRSVFSISVFLMFFLELRSQESDVQFVKCKYENYFPDSTLIAVIVDKNGEVDTISNFKIELLNYYTYNFYYDSTNQIFIFFGVTNFGEPMPPFIAQSFRMQVYHHANNKLDLINEQNFDIIENVNRKLYIKFLPSALEIMRGDILCLSIKYLSFKNPNFKVIIPQDPECK